jgi:hypothetical protein
METKRAPESVKSRWRAAGLYRSIAKVRHMSGALDEMRAAADKF